VVAEDREEDLYNAGSRPGERRPIGIAKESTFDQTAIEHADGRYFARDNAHGA
jgi:hypothetical protein